MKYIDPKKLIRDRILGFAKIAKEKLRPSPYNWRKHPEAQREALKGVFAELGFAGAELVRETKPGIYALIDGHLRLEEVPTGSKLPCLITDLSAKEAELLLASYDSLGGMAETDADMLGKLLQRVDVNTPALATMFSELAANAKVFDEKDLKLDVGDGGEGDSSRSEKSGGVELPSSHVRMVQLYLNNETYARFEKFLATLGPEYGKDNHTDVVMEALRRESRRVKSERATDSGSDRKAGGKKVG